MNGSADRYLTFTLQDELYALDIAAVTEIMEHRPLTVVPMMPAFICGVINLRGQVVPVVDLAVRFEQGRTERARRTSIVIVDTADTQQVGILVDSVSKVVELGAEDIEAPPERGAGLRSDFISGMARSQDGVAIVLDLRCVLGDARSPSPAGAPGPEGTAASAMMDGCETWSSPVAASGSVSS